MGRIAIDAVGVRSGGGARTVTDFLSALRAVEHPHNVHLFVSPRSERRFDLPLGEAWTVEERSEEDRSPLARLNWYLRGLERRCRELKVATLLTLNGMGAHGGCRCVAFVMQSLPYWPEALARLGVADRIRMATIGALTKRSCRRAALVFTQSRWMRRHLIAEFGLRENQVRLALPGTPPFPPGDAPSLRLKLERTPAHLRALYVGSDAPHKNLVIMTEGLRIARQKLGPVTLFATIPERSPYAASDGVVPVGELDRRELRVAYENVAVTVQASLVECAGLVPPEAMTCGCPVIVPDRPWARELCGDQGLYFDPHCAASFAEALGRVLSDTTVRPAPGRRSGSPGPPRPISAEYEELLSVVLASPGGSGVSDGLEASTTAGDPEGAFGGK